MNKASIRKDLVEPSAERKRFGNATRAMEDMETKKRRLRSSSVVTEEPTMVVSWRSCLTHAAREDQVHVGEPKPQ